MYKLGIVGAGHWSRRMLRGITEDIPLVIDKVVDIQPYSEKKELLNDIGVTRENYYVISQGDPIPSKFFDDLDVVQIASPIEFHREQTITSLNNDVLTVTEKSFAPNRNGFVDVLEFIDNKEMWDEIYLHLHYIKKQPTLSMPRVLDNAIDKLGEVTEVNTSFIEEYSEEDRKRGWLFTPDNGGVMLDWIHPIEVLVSGANAELGRIMNASGYLVDDRYTDTYPTAAHVKYELHGDRFSDDASVDIKVGKGFPEGKTHKAISMELEDGRLLFEYAGSEKEFSSDYRGEYRLINSNDDIVEHEVLGGPIPYEYLVRDIHGMLEGNNRGPSMNEIYRMYDPVWRYNDVIDMETPIRDTNEIRDFMDSAIQATTN